MRKRIYVPELLIRRSQEAHITTPPARLAGYFSVELVHARTGLVARRLDFRNLITDAGLNALMGTNERQLMQLLTHCGVGTGNAEPTHGDTDLQAPLLRTSSSGGFSPETSNAPGYEYFYYRTTKVFGTSEANGTLAEVGFFDGSSAGIMWCRQLMKDAAGNTTTITKTSDYELRVTYEVRVYPALADVVYQALVGGANQDVTVRPYRLASSTGWNPSHIFGARNFVQPYRLWSNALANSTNADPGGTQVQASTQTPQAYVNGTFYRETLVQWQASAANDMPLTTFTVGNISTSAGYMGAAYQHQFSAPLTKTNTYRADLLVRLSVARLEP